MIIKPRQRIAMLATTITAVLGVAAATAGAAGATEVPATVTAHAQASGSRTTATVPAPIATPPLNTTPIVIASGKAVLSRKAGAGARPSAVEVISCETFADPSEVVPAATLFGGQEKPFNSVGVATFTTCQGPRPPLSISMTSALLYNGVSETFGPPVSVSNAFEANGAVLAFCAAGDWQGGAASTINMPPGFKPQQLKLTATNGDTSFTEAECLSGIS
jgi:hypothetical protein